MHLSNEASRKIEEALDVILNSQEYFQKTCDDMKRLDLEITDIMHEIEFNEFDQEKSFQLLNEIKSLRQERRIAKEDQAVFNYLKMFHDKNGTFSDRLKETAFKMRNEINNREHRCYTPRIRTEQMSVIYSKVNDHEIAVLDDVPEEQEVVTEAN